MSATNTTLSIPYGPVMMDLVGYTLTDIERERLCHPLVGGLILFGRNYQSREQLTALCAEVHALRQPPLPIAIDHEGGRVQRCRNEFTLLPAMAELGKAYDVSPEPALTDARTIGFVLAAELRACGVDFSFTPVLDLDYGKSAVIGNRALHQDPLVVGKLAAALIAGLADAGMGACGKHFPGHGWAEADSHVAIPVDERTLDEVKHDMTPYGLVNLTAVMPAHVIFPKIDPNPAGFSPFWINLLRTDYHFDGVIFSDDLSMAGASTVGGIVARAQAAWQAGCDMLPVCNKPNTVADLLANWQPQPSLASQPEKSHRIAAVMPTRPALSWAELANNAQYQAGIAAAERLRAQSSATTLAGPSVGEAVK